jgi:hypothetical protein
MRHMRHMRHSPHPTGLDVCLLMDQPEKDVREMMRCAARDSAWYAGTLAAQLNAQRGRCCAEGSRLKVVERELRALELAIRTRMSGQKVLR